MSFDFIRNILIAPLIPDFETFLLDFFILLIIYNIITYLATLFLLQTPIYRSRKDFIDIDLRKKLCWSLGYAFATFCVTGNIVYIWLKQYFSSSVDLFPHWSTLITCLSIWGAVQLSIRKVLSEARKVIPV